MLWAMMRMRIVSTTHDECAHRADCFDNECGREVKVMRFAKYTQLTNQNFSNSSDKIDADKSEISDVGGILKRSFFPSLSRH